MPVQAEVLSLADDGCARGHVRHQVRLPVEGSLAQARGALIHNLSQTGLLIETADELTVGEVIAIDLPEAGARTAEIVWQSERLFGCQFERPISRAAVSAALLRAPVHVPATADPFVAEPSGREAEPSANDDLDSAGVRRLPLRSRALVIAGLSVASWALVGVPLAMLAL